MAWTEEQLRAALEAWKEHLGNDGRTPATIATYVRDARAFVAYLAGGSRAGRGRTATPGARSRTPVPGPGTRSPELIPVPDELRRLCHAWTHAGSPSQRGTAWPRDRWIAAFPEHADVYERLPKRLDRDVVRTVASNAHSGPTEAVVAFVATMTWGFGSVGYGPHRVRRVLETTPTAPVLLHAVARTLAADGPLAAYARLARDCRLKFLGPAFGTKYLAFCQPSGQPLVALIHDELVSAWLARNGRPDLESSSWSVPTYAAYLAQLHAWATDLGCSAETVEYLIFQAEADERGNQWSE